MIRNEHIYKGGHHRWDSSVTLRREAEMVWTSYEGGIGVHVHMEKVLEMELPGRKKRGRPRRRYMDVNCEGG